jgi:rhomboid family GlyGly-CTERM serine protease
MDSPIPDRIGRRVPWVTTAIVAASITVYLLPGVQRLLVYDRTAILRGELWRLLTGHWVHFSASHFWFDTFAVGIAGMIVEDRGGKHLGGLCLTAAIVIGCVQIAVLPRLQICGGLSGIATAVVVSLALAGAVEKGPWRLICLATLLIVALKIAFEMTTGHMLFVSGGNLTVVPVSHLTGALTAFCVGATDTLLPRLRRIPRHRPTFP